MTSRLDAERGGPARPIGLTWGNLEGAASPKGQVATAWFRDGAANPGTCNDSFGSRVPAAGGVTLGDGLRRRPE